MLSALSLSPSPSLTLSPIHQYKLQPKNAYIIYKYRILNHININLLIRNNKAANSLSNLKIFNILNKVFLNLLIAWVYTNNDLLCILVQSLTNYCWPYYCLLRPTCDPFSKVIQSVSDHWLNVVLVLDRLFLGQFCSSQSSSHESKVNLNLQITRLLSAKL